MIAIAALVRSQSAFLRCLLVILPLLLQQAAAGERDSREDAAMAYLERWQAQANVPGVSAAVSVQGKIVFSGGVGLADVETGLPMNGRIVHNIGSISKTQAVVAIMQLVEQGKVSLDAEVQQYAPWFPRKAQPITVRQILTHTSGIRHYVDEDFAPEATWLFQQFPSVEVASSHWSGDPLWFEPGTRWSYSSFATNLLQAVVESASGSAYETYLAQNVWMPAGMADTRFDIPARIVPRRGKGYERNSVSHSLENAVAENVSYKFAGGGVIATDEDLCRFGVALNSGMLLKPATLAEMYRLQLPASLPDLGQEDKKSQRASSASKQGLIFVMERDATGRVYAAHSGSVKGTKSRFANYYKEGVVVMLHLNADTASLRLETAAESLAHLYLPPLPATKTASTR